jgi:protein-disulfide isomerase
MTFLSNSPVESFEAVQVFQQCEEAERHSLNEAALKDQRTELLHVPSSPVGGNPKGDITIAEFFDFNCGYCKNVNQVVNATLKSHPKVRMVFKEFAILGPSQPSPHALNLDVIKLLIDMQDPAII